MPAPRVFRDRINPLKGLSDTELISRYRFPRHWILDLLDLVEKDISRPTGWSCAIPAVTQENKKVKVIFYKILDPDTKQKNTHIHTKHTFNNIIIKTPLVYNDSENMYSKAFKIC